MTKRLTKAFFQRPTLTVARELIGLELVHKLKGEQLVGRIVEVEAYLSNSDPACHAAKGMTLRNEPMFASGGISYVYFIYGMYYCFNVVTNKAGVGEAVLIRAIEPLTGLERMAANRKLKGKFNPRFLCNGPGKLCQALAINAKHNQQDLLNGTLYLRYSKRSATDKDVIQCSGRIGISAGSELPYRFFDSSSCYLSR